MRQGNNVIYLHGDHLGSTNATSGAVTNSGVVYFPFGSPRAGNLPTDYTFTGQKFDASDSLMYYGARYYDAALGRFISADTIVPGAGNPQSLNRYAYTLNNPLRYTDPSGHWDEETLAKILGKDWRDKYFGKDGVFKGRDNLLDLLTSDKTSNENELDIIRQFLEAAAKAHAGGFDFSEIDALGVRFTLSGGTGGSIGGILDVLLNVSSGELSIFGSPQVGVMLGAKATISGGVTLLKQTPSNDSFRRTFMGVGAIGAYGGGATVEGFWSSPLPDDFNITHGPNGLYVGGVVGQGVGISGNISYSFEFLRVNAQGDHWGPFVPSLIEMSVDVYEAIKHDVFNNPVLPWSPYRYR